MRDSAPQVLRVAGTRSRRMREASLHGHIVCCVWRREHELAQGVPELREYSQFPMEVWRKCCLLHGMRKM